VEKNRSLIPIQEPELKRLWFFIFMKLADPIYGREERSETSPL
jgi:hypothetical protein